LALVVLGYNYLRESPARELPPSPAASRAGSGVVLPANDAVIGAPQEAGPAVAAKPAAAAELDTGHAISPPKPVRRIRQPAKPQPANAAVGLAESSPATGAARIERRSAPSGTPCSESIAALGLCTPDLAPVEAANAGAAETNTAASQARDTMTNGRQDASARGACPAAEEALGLCTRQTSQGER
jgi:hypothetical protein